MNITDRYPYGIVNNRPPLLLVLLRMALYSLALCFKLVYFTKMAIVRGTMQRRAYIAIALAINKQAKAHDQLALKSPPHTQEKQTVYC